MPMAPSKTEKGAKRKRNERKRGETVSVRLDKLASLRWDIPESRAAALIMEGRVLVDGVLTDKPGTPVNEQSALSLRSRQKQYASRSGYKLEKALKTFSLNVAGKKICDIGASNGGFTDCLLQHSAARVWAVDVAYGILDWKLRCDSRVTPIERTNARYLTRENLGEACDMVTADVSFISLCKLFGAIDQILSEEGELVTLIKPQFEAPRKNLGKNGILRDKALLPGIIQNIANNAAGHGLYLQDLTVSPIYGSNGDEEYLALFNRFGALSETEQNQLIEKALFQSPETPKHTIH